MSMQAPTSLDLVELRRRLESLAGVLQGTAFVTGTYFSIQVDIGEFIAKVSAIPGAIYVEVALMQHVEPDQLLNLLRSISVMVSTREVGLFSGLDDQKDVWDIDEPDLPSAIRTSLLFHRTQWKRMVPGDDRKGTLVDACKLLLGE